MLKGKTVLLGVSGSIAAYKIASLASALKKLASDAILYAAIQDRIACQCIKEAGRRCACADDAECHELYQSDHV